MGDVPPMPPSGKESWRSIEPQLHSLGGGSGLTEEQEAAYAAWAERIERNEYEPAATGLALEGDEAAAHARAELDSILSKEDLDRILGADGERS